MNIYWFGTPWPNEERRHPICADDDNRLRSNMVLNQNCVECGKQFKNNDHGVITQCVGNVWRHFWLDLEGDNQCVCAYHLRCWLSEVVGGVMSEKVRSRITGEGFAHITQDGPQKWVEAHKNQVTGGTEDAEIGRGWNR